MDATGKLSDWGGLITKAMKVKVHFVQTIDFQNTEIMVEPESEVPR